MEKTYRYYGLDTCAATGLCAERCPVGINTGDLVRKLRQNHTEKAKKIASWTGEHFATVTASAKAGLTVASKMHNVLGTNRMRKLTQKSLPTFRA